MKAIKKIKSGKGDRVAIKIMFTESLTEKVTFKQRTGRR